MPLRRLTSRDRTEEANWQLAGLLAFVAGVVDVSGYLALRQFTSHMSGMVAALAVDLGARGVGALVAPGVGLLAFLAGAAVCAVLVNGSRRRNLESRYAVPVLLEAVLLAALAVPAVHGNFYPTLAVMTFCMGLQNATVTKLSHAEIRTTHVTGMVTDIGIELGKAMYWSRNRALEPVRSNARRLRLLSTLVGLFLAGGVAGALLWPRMGFLVMLPLTVALAAFTVLPILADIRGVQAEAR